MRIFQPRSAIAIVLAVVTATILIGTTVQTGQRIMSSFPRKKDYCAGDKF